MVMAGPPLGNKNTLRHHPAGGRSGGIQMSLIIQCRKN